MQRIWGCLQFEKVEVFFPLQKKCCISFTKEIGHLPFTNSSIKIGILSFHLTFKNWRSSSIFKNIWVIFHLPTKLRLSSISQQIMSYTYIKRWCCLTFWAYLLWYNSNIAILVLWRLAGWLVGNCDTTVKPAKAELGNKLIKNWRMAWQGNGDRRKLWENSTSP